MKLSVLFCAASVLISGCGGAGSATSGAGADGPAETGGDAEDSGETLGNTADAGDLTPDTSDGLPEVPGGDADGPGPDVPDPDPVDVQLVNDADEPGAGDTGPGTVDDAEDVADGPCHPECENKHCGGDGCGGECGHCSASALCDSGLCVPASECGDGQCGAREDVTCAEDCHLCDCLAEGDWYRFDFLAVNSLGGDPQHAFIPTLNALWKADLAKDELSVLLQVVSATETEVELAIVAGARVGGTEICLLPATATTTLHPRSGCSLKASTETTINVFAGSEAHPKYCSDLAPVGHTLPVRRAILESTIAADCSRISEGVIVSGVLGEEELSTVCTCLVLFPDSPSSICGDLDPSYDQGGCPGCNAKFISLGVLIPGYGAVEFDCLTQSEKPALCLTGSFSAVRLDATPPECAQ
jgi:hypothetical protein